jgi:CheY-like chemotaxis protein
MSVLLVEDEPGLREIIAFYLEEAGLHVCEAVSAHEALELLHDPAYSFSVLVTDLGLGYGDDGLELAIKARQHLRDLYVVYETGSSERMQGRPLAYWETLFEKPYDMVKLTDVVFSLDRQATRQRRHRRAMSLAGLPL